MCHGTERPCGGKELDAGQAEEAGVFSLRATPSGDHGPTVCGRDLKLQDGSRTGAGLFGNLSKSNHTIVTRDRAGRGSRMTTWARGWGRG